MINLKTVKDTINNSHKLMGNVNDVVFEFDLTTLTGDNLTAYNDFISFTGLYSMIVISNYPEEIEVIHLIQNDVTGKIVDLDYTSLTETEKIIIDNAVNLFKAALV